MNRNRLHLIVIALLCGWSTYSQVKAVQKLDEVYLTDTKLVAFSEGFKVDKLQDSVVKRNAASLTDVLRFNSSIYFKENGHGMVSSPSFRGTNAAQTAVIWNGININSIFTGQTDFNIISPLGYDEIAIRSGGGGVQYGSGAVGGSIHLNNQFSFDAENDTQLGFGYGSFGTVFGNTAATRTWKDHYLNVGVDFISSENDYDYIGKNKKNLHGEFLRFSAKINEARKLKRGMASWNSEYSYSDRNFSGSLNTIGVDAYKDVNTRNLLQLHQQFGKFKTVAKAAHLFEQYRYYPNSEKPFYQGGKAHTFIGSLESEVLVRNQVQVHGKMEFTQINGEGENVGEHTRKTMAAVALIKHEVSDKFGYGINLRQEFLNDFDNPLLFSADARWQATRFYAIRMNGSKNYRIPTFNDLYWQSGGNSDLKPEVSYQMEIGHEFSVEDFSFDVATYYITSKNLIKWVPVSGAIWQPENIAESRNFGVEAKGAYAFKWRQHLLRLEAMYTYTNAEDLEKNKQLIYVPYHKMSGTLTYDYNHRVSAYFQTAFTGEAYTTTDNSSVVDAHTVINLGATYKFLNTPSISIGGRINNLLNSYYENVAYRPMPSRNIQIFLNLKI